MGKRTNLEKEITCFAKRQYPNDEILRKALEFGAWWFYNKAIESMNVFVNENIRKYIKKNNEFNTKKFCKDFDKYLKK